MKCPQIFESETVYRGFFEVRHDKVEKRDGSPHLYSSLILLTDATAVLAQDTEGKWILNREYRHPTGQFLLGCPGGRLEPGEDPILGGQREFFEETGYWSDEILLLGSSHPFPGICNQKVYYLWAKNAFKKGIQNLDDFEIIETELKTDAELLEEISKESKIDAILCSALYYKHLFTQTRNQYTVPE